jgi:hypothetical protein
MCECSTGERTQILGPNLVIKKARRQERSYRWARGRVWWTGGKGIDILLLDIQFARDIVEFDGWLTFFSTARNHAPKGVVLLTY